MSAFVAAAWEFLTSKVGMFTIATLGIIFAVWLYGHRQYEKGYAAAVAEAQAAGAKIAKQQPKIIHDLQIKYLPQQERIVTVTKTITKEVPKYVTLHDDAACTLNRGFVRLHDAAADNTVPSGVRGDDEAPAGVAPSAVVTTVAENYGICHESATRLAEWQEWYVRNKAIFETGARHGH